MLAAMRAQLPGTVVFVFQPAEEGAPDGEEGGARLMLKENALEPRPEAMFLRAMKRSWRLSFFRT